MSVFFIVGLEKFLNEHIKHYVRGKETTYEN